MVNKYGLPEDKLKEIRERDQQCVYCGEEFEDPKTGGSYCKQATIEHLNFEKPWNNPETVAYCCRSCNSSRRDKKLEYWFKKPYCTNRRKPINEETVADPVKDYIRSHPIY